MTNPLLTLFSARRSANSSKWTNTNSANCSPKPNCSADGCEAQSVSKLTKEESEAAQKALEKLREKFLLDTLPETILVPLAGGASGESVKPLETATVDDLSFCLLKLDSDISALCSKHSALKRLHNLARQNGALGSDNAVLATVRDGGAQ